MPWPCSAASPWGRRKGGILGIPQYSFVCQLHYGVGMFVEIDTKKAVLLVNGDFCIVKVKVVGLLADGGSRSSWLLSK